MHKNISLFYFGLLQNATIFFPSLIHRSTTNLFIRSIVVSKCAEKQITAKKKICLHFWRWKSLFLVSVSVRRIGILLWVALCQEVFHSAVCILLLLLLFTSTICSLLCNVYSVLCWVCVDVDSSGALVVHRTWCETWMDCIFFVVIFSISIEQTGYQLNLTFFFSSWVLFAAEHLAETWSNVAAIQKRDNWRLLMFSCLNRILTFIRFYPRIR